MTPAECLNAAADLLEREGWCQHTMGDYNGPRCLQSALIDVAPEGYSFKATYAPSERALRDRIGSITHD